MDTLILPFHERFKQIEEQLGEDYDISSVNFEVISVTKQKLSNIISIARKVALFLDLQDIKEFLLVNKKFLLTLLTEEICTHICCLLLKYTCPEKLNPPKLTKHFARLAGGKISDYVRLFKVLSVCRNLLKNPGFDHKFDSWEVIQGGTGPGIFDDDLFKNRKFKLKFSFRWGIIRQSFELPAGKNRILTAGVIVSRKCDCDSMMMFKLTTKDGEKCIQKNVPGTKPGLSIYEWNLEVVHMMISDDTQSAVVEFQGKDAPFWGGEYGPQVGYVFAFCFDFNQKKPLIVDNLSIVDDPRFNRSWVDNSDNCSEFEFNYGSDQVESSEEEENDED
jgi:hypothetical protein